MKFGTFKRIKASQHNIELVEFDLLTDEGDYITTCSADVPLLTIGGTTFHCGNGDDVELTPEQQLKILRFIREDRKKCLKKGHRVRTLEDWESSGIPIWEEFCPSGSLIAEDIVMHFANCLPPVSYFNSYIQAGEVDDYERDKYGVYRETYATFSKTDETDPDGNRVWVFNGYCFRGDVTPAGAHKNSLDTIIQELEQTIK